MSILNALLAFGVYRINLYRMVSLRMDVILQYMVQSSNGLCHLKSKRPLSIEVRLITIRTTQALGIKQLIMHF